MPRGSVYHTPARTSHRSTPSSNRIRQFMSAANSARSLYNSPFGQRASRGARSIASSISSAFSRRASMSSGTSAASNRTTSTVRADVANRTGSTTRKAAATRNKQIAAKKKHTPKVSRAFSAKVKKVFDSREIKGTVVLVGQAIQGQPVDGGQSVYSHTQLGAASPYLFSPDAVLYAASRLWYGNTVGGTHLFPTEGLEVNVIASKATFRFKNNTQHTLTMELYNCAATANIDGNNPPFIGRLPADVFADTLALDATEGLNRSGLNAYAGGGPVIKETYGATPGMTNGFRKIWKSTHRTVVLEPGQTFTHVLVGPSTLYKWNNFDLGPVTTRALTKNLSHALMLILKTDLIGGTLNQVGRFGHTVSGGSGLLVECTEQYVLGMPEKTGFSTGFLAGAVSLDLRKPGYIHEVNTNGGNVGITTVRVDEENPPVYENP